MSLINNFFDTNYFFSYLLFSTSIYLYFNKINYNIMKKNINNRVKKYLKHNINITNDTNDSNIMMELRNNDIDLDNDLDIDMDNDLDMNNNLDSDEYNYFYYCDKN